MPANLPPDYYAAENAFRTAATPQAKLEALERMLAVMPHHKGTDHLRAELRARQAKLSQEVGRQRAHGHTDPYAVRREGAGQALLVGMPNSGKSSLLHALTGAPARLADYPFTTQLPQPAMMAFEDLQVQLVDLPAVAPGATAAWLRGLVPHADLLLLVIDLDADPTSDLRVLEAELAAMHVSPCSPAAAHAAADETPQVQPALVLGTKMDLPAAADGAELLSLELEQRLPLLATSAISGTGLDEARQAVVHALNVVRVYAKPPGRPPDLTRPFVLRRGATVADLADVVHHELRERLHFAVKWPPGGAPRRVAHQYELEDRDVIELHAG
jgi:ribosome-interacting GTPase 1